VALELFVRRRLTVAGETRRRGLPEVGWEWQRAKGAAKEDDPQRVETVARLRVAVAQLGASAALFFAEEWDSNLVPKLG
jgi:hypothetical protein